MTSTPLYTLPSSVRLPQLDEPVILVSVLLAIVFISWAIGSGSTVYDPADPPLVKTLLPWIGGALEYANDIVGYFRKCKLRYGSVFKVSMAGLNIVVVSDPEGIVDFYHDARSTLSTHALHVIMTQAIGGVKRDVAHVMDQQLVPIMTRAMAKQPMEKIIPDFNQQLHHHLGKMLQNKAEIRLPLRRFVGLNLYSSTSAAMLGDMYPLDNYEDFFMVDEHLPLLMPFASIIPLILSRIPSVTRSVFQARDRMVASMGTYMDKAWREDHVEGATQMITEVVRALHQSGLPPAEANGMLFNYMWGIHSNLLRVTYWLLSYLLSDAEAMARIRAEVDRAFETQFSDLNSLLSAPSRRLEGDTFPLLESAIRETLRLTVLPTSVRQAYADTEIVSAGGRHYNIHKGEYVLANTHLLHTSEEYHQDAHKFRVDRFLDDEYTSIERKFGQLSAKPMWEWGGGIHLCKGRHFATHQMKMFVILTLRLFDVSATFADGSSMEGRAPRPNYRNLGAMSVSDDEVVISLRKRQD